MPLHKINTRINFELVWPFVEKTWHISCLSIKQPCGLDLWWPKLCFSIYQWHDQSQCNGTRTLVIESTIKRKSIILIFIARQHTDTQYWYRNSQYWYRLSPIPGHSHNSSAEWTIKTHCVQVKDSYSTYILSLTTLSSTKSVWYVLWWPEVRIW